MICLVNSDNGRDSHRTARARSRHNIYHIPYIQHFKTKNISLTMAATQQTFPQTPHSYYTRDIKTNTCYTHTKYKIWCMAVPSSWSDLLYQNTKYCAQFHHTLAALKTRRTLAQQDAKMIGHISANLAQQINHPFSNHTYTKSTPNNIHHHHAPFVTLTPTTHIISSTASTYTPRCHPWICGQTPPE